MTAVVVAVLGEVGLARVLVPSVVATGRLVTGRIPTVVVVVAVEEAVARMITDSHRGDALTRGRRMRKTVPGVRTGKAQKTGTGPKRGEGVAGRVDIFCKA